LLAAAEEDGFDLLLTTDKNIRYQQNLSARKIGIVVLGNSTWRIVRLHLDRIALAVNQKKRSWQLRGSGNTVRVRSRFSRVRKVVRLATQYEQDDYFQQNA
jgi:hypothetical protein